MNPIDSSVESIEAEIGKARQRSLGRCTLVKPFEEWLRVRSGTFAITFRRFCSETNRPLIPAAQ